MTQPQRIRRLISVEEYHKMAEAGILSHKDRVELINGEILHMSPIGLRHTSIVNKINTLFLPPLLEKAIVQIQGPIQIQDFSEPEPDILILKPDSDFYYSRKPEPKDSFLLIEVSDPTYDFDKTTKLEIYAKAGISEYWIVNISKKQIELHRNPEGNIYKNITIARNDDEICCISFPEFKIQVKAILR